MSHRTLLVALLGGSPAAGSIGRDRPPAGVVDEMVPRAHRGLPRPRRPEATAAALPGPGWVSPKTYDFSREPDIQRAVVNIYRAFGCTVLRFSDYGTGPKRTPPGWPDLIVCCPQKRRLWAHEVKTASGVQSTAQQDVETLLAVCGVEYVLGGVHEAQAQLAHLDLLAGATSGCP